MIPKKKFDCLKCREEVIFFSQTFTDCSPYYLQWIRVSMDYFDKLKKIIFFLCHPLVHTTKYARRAQRSAAGASSASRAADPKIVLRLSVVGRAGTILRNRKKKTVRSRERVEGERGKK